VTVYVDDARIPKGRSLWSHLTADTEAELHEFALRIGLVRRWFQHCKTKCGRTGEPCIHWHYDVVASKRHQAVRAGAVEIDLCEMGELMRRRREALRASG
jgi:hypothetical protein